MITIISDGKMNYIGEDLVKEMTGKGHQVEHISLEGVTIKPCTNCGGCTYKTYGKCVVRDDGDWIFPKVIQSDVILFVTPIVFGSYSFPIKRLFDKFALIMERFYYIENKELVKGGMQGRKFKFFVLGAIDTILAEEEQAFQKLHHENLRITRGVGKAFLMNSILTTDMKKQITEEVLKA